MYNIYPTLLDSFMWFKNSYDYKEREAAKTELFNKINRVPEPESAQAAKGKEFKLVVDSSIDFFETTGELRIFDVIGEHETYSRGILNEFSKRLAWSVKEFYTEAEIEVNGSVVNVYGYVDNIKQDVIYDVKFVQKYDLAKYFQSSQRLVYPYCINHGNGGQCNYFEFIATNGTDIFTERYDCDEKKILPLLKNRLNEFIEFIEKNRNFITDKKIFGQ